MKMMVEIDTDTQVVVPMEPTSKMLAAAYNAVESEGVVTTTWMRETIYRAMMAAAPKPKQAQQSDINIDAFALELMQKVWSIGNRSGPDSQRKAQIQEAIADAVGLLMTQQQAEPVEYQRRMRPLWDSQEVWTPWEKCTKGTYEDCIRVPVLHDWEHQVRALYTAPQAQPAPIPTSERLPRDADADCAGFVWMYSRAFNAWAIEHWEAVTVDLHSHWLPTGLTRPAEPGGE